MKSHRVVWAVVGKGGIWLFLLFTNGTLETQSEYLMTNFVISGQAWWLVKLAFFSLPV